MSTPQAPAGWYDDGQHPGRQRYWDGERWTEHFHPPIAPAAVPPAPVRAARQGGSRRYWAWLAPVLVVVVAGGTVLGLALGGVFGGNDSPTGAIGQLIAGSNERDCGKILASTTIELGESMSTFYCGEPQEGDEYWTVAFRPTQTFATEHGATVLGILTQTGESVSDSHSTCYAITTVIDRGRWRVAALRGDGLPSDVELDETAPRYCTGTPELAQ